MVGDDYSFVAARHEMVDRQLSSRGIRDPRVLTVMSAVPRHRFLPESLARVAYSDRAVPLALGQTVSQPYMVAAMTEALAVRPSDRVLEVGTGSGYQTAVLAALAREVYTVERLAELADEARLRLARLRLANVEVLVGDGTLGWPEHAPFDAILVTAAAPSVPSPLFDQLDDDGGRLVAPIGERRLQQLTRYVRTGTELKGESLMPCRFVPLLGKEGWHVGR